VSPAGTGVYIDQMTAAERGSGLCFEDFYRRELPGLIILARGLCGPTLAEEVAQEAMLVAYRRWRQIGDLHYPEAWTRRVCANLAVSQVRRRAIEVRALLRLSGRRVSGEPEQPVVEDDFWREVRLLPRRQAQAVALRYVYDLSVADIALTLNCSEGTVKVHLTRGRGVLAKRLHASPGDEA
jgi:RNA polymerase sigma-70 factor (ECF subfamily)